jgi:DNA-binding NarL/FixJ family response regulator
VSGAQVNGVGANGTRVNGTRLDGTRLDGTKLDGTKLGSAKAIGTRFEGAAVDTTRVNGTPAKEVGVFVQAQDPVSRAGVSSQLAGRPGLELVGESEQERAEVVVVVVDGVDDDAVRTLHRIQRTSAARIVLVATTIDDADLVQAIECGVLGLVRRLEATPERLCQVISATARGEGSVPSDLLGRLLDQVGHLQRQVLNPRGLTFNGLARREIEVLRLVAEGYDTGEIARQLSYSERTVKNVMHDITSRLHLRNRPHAVAYALRQGLI